MQVAASAVLFLVIFLLSVCNLSVCDPPPPITFKYEDKELTCKDLTKNGTGDDVCQVVHACFHRGFDDGRCHQAVLIAEENGNILEAKSIGVAVGKHYILSTVSSNFRKFFEEERRLFVLVGKEAYLLRDATVIPRMIPGDFDAHGWHDLLLIELPKGQAFANIPFANISRSVPIESDTKEDRADAFCRERRVNSELASQQLLIGAPFYVLVERKTPYLVGMRSFTAEDRSFLITKLAPYCDWLETTSNGEVKCFD
uniref:Peptidase S1 domain-containing protein n=1 Tax=Panagrellus redivivus TaxID=6233 RepID=A0A7E4VZS7_PANRE